MLNTKGWYNSEDIFNNHEDVFITTKNTKEHENLVITNTLFFVKFSDFRFYNHEIHERTRKLGYHQHTLFRNI